MGESIFFSRRGSNSTINMPGKVNSNNMYGKKNRDNKPSKKSSAGGGFVRERANRQASAAGVTGSAALRAHEGAVYNCRKCRFQLFSGSDELLDQTFAVGSSSFFFPAPLEWMGELPGVEDKLKCPNCEAKVGSYNWSGTSVGSSGWVAPAIQLSRSKVDQQLPDVITDVKGGLEEVLPAFEQLKVEDQDCAKIAGESSEQDGEVEEQNNGEENDEERAEGEEFSLTNIWQLENVDHFPNDICREYTAAFVSNNFVKIGSLLAQDVAFSSPVGDCAGLEKVLEALRMTRGRMAEEVDVGAPKASGPSSSKVELQFVSANGKTVKLVDNVVVQRRVITQISRVKA
jgi:hypothetical protein